MGAAEDGTSAKSSKPGSSAQQEAPPMPATHAYPDWSTSMQAFYGAGAAPPFFNPNVASPPPHPFMWGGQHPMMPPYGTPVPYPAMYPPGAVYAHPSMATAAGPIHGTTEVNGKAPEGKDQNSSKKSKSTSGNLSSISGKTRDVGKVASGSGNDVGTQSGESGSEGSSDASDDHDNQEFSASKKGSFHQMLADGANAQNGAGPGSIQTTVPGNPVVPMPGTNLNIGMDLWNASAAGSGGMKLHHNQPGVSPPVAPSGMMNDPWVQDERELKKQKRKQSNRESARRSRLRKQAECEELQHKVDALSNENHTLRDELQKLSEECEKLTSENNSIKDELTKVRGPDAVSKLDNGNNSVKVQSRGDEGNR